MARGDTDDITLNISMEPARVPERTPAARILPGPAPSARTERTTASSARRGTARAAAAGSTGTRAAAPAHAPGQPEGDAPKRKPHGPPQVISSLFTRNPPIEAHAIDPCAAAASLRIAADIFPKQQSLDIASLQPALAECLRERFHLVRLTNVQERAIPAIARGHDVLVKSATGSGKTLAYLIPIVQALATSERRICRTDGTYVVILAPTRELALQIHLVLQRLLRPFHWLVAGLFTGGEKRKSEKSRLRHGITILVATPGRLLDHLRHTQALLQRLAVRWLVLDEADRLTDMGFEHDVGAVVAMLDGLPDPDAAADHQPVRADRRAHDAQPQQPSQPRQHHRPARSRRQTIMLSATLHDGVRRLAVIALRDPVYVDGDVLLGVARDASRLPPVADAPARGNRERPMPDAETADALGAFRVPMTLQQHYVIVPAKQRLVALAAFVLARLAAGEKLIVFVSNRDTVDFLADILHGAAAADDEGDLDGTPDGNGDVAPGTVSPMWARLHGNMLQADRMRMFANFGVATCGVMLTTDVAARGLDLPSVEWIVQFSAPCDTAAYVHRVGRTARCGHRGHALLFLMPHEVAYLDALRANGLELTEYSVTELLQSLSAKPPVQRKPRAASSPSSSYLEAATRLQLRLERYVLRDASNLAIARAAYLSYVRAYTTYPAALKSIFNVHRLHLGHVAKSFALREAPCDTQRSTRALQAHKGKARSAAVRRGSTAVVSAQTHPAKNGLVRAAKRSTAKRIRVAGASSAWPSYDGLAQVE